MGFNGVLVVFCIGVFTGVMATKTVTDMDTNSSISRAKQITECEAKLPRDVKCILVANPEVTK